MHATETKSVMKPLECSFFGDEFYFESGTIMSSICGADGSRQDLGTVNSALVAGREVRIRPATDIELIIARAELYKIISASKKGPITGERQRAGRCP